MIGLSLDCDCRYDARLCFHFTIAIGSFLLVPAITIMFGGVAFIIYFFLSRSLMEKEIGFEKKNASGRINDTGWMSESG